MLLVLSPAKTLDLEPVSPALPWTTPDYLPDSALLIERLRHFSPAELAGLMSISDPLAVLNCQRYSDWAPPFSPANAKQAVLAFAGDVYEGLEAGSLGAADLDFAQSSLRILSGLYGLLRPLDLIQAYRLEMGTRLNNLRGKDLYAFWGDSLTQAVNRELADQGGEPVLVNLASEEYFKALRPKKLAAKVIQPVFEDWKGGKYKVISFFAKRARGLMARHVVEQRLQSPEGMRDFAVEGYAFAPEASDATSWVFRRRSED
ncbi:MAG: hypothetical protein RIR00_1373 [Pseudomonadota bacterium]|jgi:cytoplasmic iron level regulating protein YaaA (DUF328/UPF0246 family)